MTITTIPQQNEGAGQLGKSKVDGAGVYDADTKIKAAQWNQNVLRLIELFNEVGLSDGSTAGSINARVKGLEAAVPTNADVSGFWDDFLDVGTGSGWIANQDTDASAGIAPSATAIMGFPSRGIAGLFVQPDAVGGSKTSLARIGSGLMFSDTIPIRLLFRTSKPVRLSDFAVDPTGGTSGATIMWAMVGGFGEEGPTVGVILSAGVDGDNHRVWSVLVVDGDFEAPTSHAVTMPDCDWFEVLITAGVDGVEVEVSPEGGAFASILDAPITTSIPDGIYIPYLFAQAAAGGDMGVLVDGVGGSGVRDTTHAGDLSQRADWPSGVSAGDLAAETTAREDADTAIALPDSPNVSGSTLLLDATYNGKTIRCTNSGGCTITVPDSLPVGFSCAAFPDHATGSVTWDQSGTMVLQNADGFLSATTRYALSGVTVHSATLAIVGGAVNS